MTHKIVFNLKFLRKDREGHCIFIKGKIHQEDIAIQSIFARYTGHPNIKKDHKGSTSIAKITYNASHSDRGVTQHTTLTSRQVIQIKTKERNAIVK